MGPMKGRAFQRKQLAHFRFFLSHILNFQSFQCHAACLLDISECFGDISKELDLFDAQTFVGIANEQCSFSLNELTTGYTVLFLDPGDMRRISPRKGLQSWARSRSWQRHGLSWRSCPRHWTVSKLRSKKQNPCTFGATVTVPNGIRNAVPGPLQYSVE